MVENPPANTGNAGSIPGSRRSPGEGNGNPLQYSCLENPMDRGACRAIVLGIAEWDTTEPTNTHTMMIYNSVFNTDLFISFLFLKFEFIDIS